MDVSDERATFREVFQVREFRVLFGSFALLVGGDGVKMLALSVLVFERTGSPGLSAAAYMAGWLPYLLGGMFLLSLADRLPPRGLMVAGELVRLVVCLALAYAGLPVWAMLALILVSGLFSPVFGAARSAMLPEVLPGDAFVLGRSLLGMTSAGAQIGGLALGGGMLAVAGPEGALAITAGISAVAALVLRLGLPYSPARSVARTPAATGSGPGAAAGAGPVRAGAVRATLRVNRGLLAAAPVRGLLLAMWVPPMFLAGAEAMVVPYLTAAGSATAAGLALATAAAGMAAGEFAVGRFAAPSLRERLSFPLALAMGAPWLLFAMEPGLVVTALLAALSAACLAYQLGLQRRFLEAVPEEVRGQAYGLQSAGLMTGQAVGAAGVGALAEVAGPGLAMAASGAIGIAAALALATTLKPPPSNRTPPEPSPSETPPEVLGPERPAPPESRTV
ncbi:MFS transporter [Nonomuraea dietziae]|uniref:MFS transporter n=1 Tax=Nonomuraea dietziae TaxID=65515 RepID=UPI0034027E7F